MQNVFHCVRCFQKMITNSLQFYIIDLSAAYSSLNAVHPRLNGTRVQFIREKSESRKTRRKTDEGAEVEAPGVKSRNRSFFQGLPLKLLGDQKTDSPRWSSEEIKR